MLEDAIREMVRLLREIRDLVAAIEGREPVAPADDIDIGKHAEDHGRHETDP